MIHFRCVLETKNPIKSVVFDAVTSYSLTMFNHFSRSSLTTGGMHPTHRSIPLVFSFDLFITFGIYAFPDILTRLMIPSSFLSLSLYYLIALIFIPHQRSGIGFFKFLYSSIFFF